MQVVLALQEGESLNAVDSNVQIDSGVGDAEGLFRQADVTGTVSTSKTSIGLLPWSPIFFTISSVSAKRGRSPPD